MKYKLTTEINTSVEVKETYPCLRKSIHTGCVALFKNADEYTLLVEGAANSTVVAAHNSFANRSSWKLFTGSVTLTGEKI